MTHGATGSTSFEYVRELPLKLQNVEADVAVDHVNEAALVERHVIALRRGPARHRLGNEMADLARAERVGDVDDPQPATEPDGVGDGTGHPLTELVGAEACAARAAEGRVELTDLKLRERLDGAEIADVEGQQARMRAPAPRLLLARALRLVLLVDRKRDAAAADAIRDGHHRVSRLRKQWMVIVVAGTFRPREVGHVDDPEAAVPAARPHLVAESQRVVKPVPAARPTRSFAALDVLPGHPPA